MDKKNKIFFLVFFLLLFGSVAFTYYRIIIRKDYVVEAQVDCDPASEACFVWECDPDSTVEGEACTGDSEADIWYYKLTKRNASMVPLCNPDEDETCDPWTCEAGEKDCEEILCNEENKIDQEVECNDPDEYLLNNPPEEEEKEADCEEDDEDCLNAEEEADETETGEEVSESEEGETVGGEIEAE